MIQMTEEAAPTPARSIRPDGEMIADAAAPEPPSVAPGSGARRPEMDHAQTEGSEGSAGLEGVADSESMADSEGVANPGRLAGAAEAGAGRSAGAAEAAGVGGMEGSGSGERSVGAADSKTDRLESLGDEIAELAAHIHAANYRLLVRLREFDMLFEQAGGLWGFRSAAHWLSWRTSMSPLAARERVRAARALGDLPLISAAMERGELSYSKVRALTRLEVDDRETEEEVLEIAHQATAAQVEKLVRSWRRVERLEGAAAQAGGEVAGTAEQIRHEGRELELFPDEDGSWVVRGRLDPEVGALLEKALDLASEALYPRALSRRKIGDDRTAVSGGAGREDTKQMNAGVPRTESSQEPAAKGPGGPVPVAEAGPTEAEPTVEREPLSRRRADALGLLAETLLQSGLVPSERSSCEDSASRSDAPSPVPDRRPALARPKRSPDTGPRTPAGRAGRADRFQVVLHVDLDTLRDEDDGRGRSFLDDGPGVPAGTARRLSCDASRVVMFHDENGKVLDVGRRSRTVPASIRRALAYRDRHCRFPGCTSRLTDAHHIEHWAHGGETKLDNLVLLCRTHHRAVHEGDVRLERTSGAERTSGLERASGAERTSGAGLDSTSGSEREGTGRNEKEGKLRFFRPDGCEIPLSPPLPQLQGDAVQRLAEVERARGIEIDAWTAAPKAMPVNVAGEGGAAFDVDLALGFFLDARRE